MAFFFFSEVFFLVPLFFELFFLPAPHIDFLPLLPNSENMPFLCETERER